MPVPKAARSHSRVISGRSHGAVGGTAYSALIVNPLCFTAVGSRSRCLDDDRRHVIKLGLGAAESDCGPEKSVNDLPGGPTVVSTHQLEDPADAEELAVRSVGLHNAIGQQQ